MRDVLLVAWLSGTSSSNYPVPCLLSYILDQLTMIPTVLILQCSAVVNSC
jgi:hypothetical protein